jgi:hypothetical protein
MNCCETFHTIDGKPYLFCRYYGETREKEDCDRCQIRENLKSMKIA